MDAEGTDRVEAAPFIGQVQELGSNRPFLLEGDAVWFVERGEVDVFSVLLGEGRPVGPRRHLLRVPSGQLLLALGQTPAAGGRGFLAVATHGSRLVTAAGTTLRALLEAPRTAALAGRLVDRWVGQLQDIVGLPASARRPAHERRETLEEVAVAVRAHAERVAAEAERATGQRTERLAAASQATIQRACARLASSLGGPDAPVLTSVESVWSTSAEGHHGALVACCRVVGARLGVEIKAPFEAESGKPLRDPLAAVMRSSRLRARKVALRGQWWRRDYGPLVGARAEGSEAVALLPSPRGYLLKDPTGSGPVAGTPIDAALAATLAPFAHTLYRPFPDGPLGVRALLRFAARGSSADLVTMALSAVVVTILGMVPPLSVDMLFNSVIPGARRSQLWQVTMLLIAAALANSAFSIVRGVALLRIQQRMGSSVQAAVWDRLMRLPLTFFRPYTAGDLATRAMAIDAIQQNLSGVTVTAILSGIFSLANLAMMFHYSTAMALQGLVLLAVAMAVTTVGGLLHLPSERRMMRLRARTSGLVLQLLTSIGKLRVAGAEARAFALWVDRFTRQRRLQFTVRAVGSWLTAFSAAFPVLASVLIYRAGLASLSEEGSNLRTGDFLAFGAAFSSCLGSLLGTCRAMVDALSSVALYDQARPILQTLPEASAGKSDPGVLAGEIEIQHAVFRYGGDGPPALRDVSLHIAAGEFVALVGPSGSGKSTLLRLLLGFEKLESGSIYYDGQELGGLDVQEVRRQMGVVLQNGRLIVGDIFRNIVGSGTATQEEAWEAARMAGIADDINAMPMKMHTVIGEDASTLSGGQRQRLMIARAIVNRPRILLFDEATSALDNRTQAIVTASLERLQATRIVVAHRLSTIANAARIYVVERGRIVQSGSYGELIAEPGAFAELARRQLV
jgi:NHLM bacteriocin system ABC transporter ATP-binding protein